MAGGSTSLERWRDKISGSRKKIPRDQTGQSASSVKNFNWIVGDIAKKNPAFAAEAVHKIKPSELQIFLAPLTLAPKSFNTYTEILGQIFDLAVNDGNLAKNPISAIEGLRKKVKGKPRQIPTDGQFQAILENIRIQPFQPKPSEPALFLEFLSLAALGEAEAGNLEWPDVDWEKEKVVIRRQKTGEYFDVPFYPWLKMYLVNLWELRGKPKTGKVFKVSDCHGSLQNAVERLKKAKHPLFNSATKLFSPRDLRNVRLLRAGLSPALVAKAQGHKDKSWLITTTYADVINDNDAAHEKAMIQNLKVVEH